MRTFLGVFLVLIVSGDGNTDKTIEGILEDSVLLPCTCSARDPDVFKWQLETKPKPTPVLKYNMTVNVSDSFQGRVQTFLTENSNNCSVLLTNITADDQGKYRCSFRSQGQYKKFFLNLIVFVKYNVCKKESDNRNRNGKIAECHVQGRYKETEIQWKLDGQPLTNSSTTIITNSSPDFTGDYHFLSTLSTKLNTTAELQCDVKANGISPKISLYCEPKTGFTFEEPGYVMRYTKIFPIMLVLGISLFLWRRWNSHRL